MLIMKAIRKGCLSAFMPFHLHKKIVFLAYNYVIPFPDICKVNQ